MLAAIFIMRMLNEKRQTPQINRKVEGAHPINRSAMARNNIEVVMGWRLSNRDTSHPERGKPASELMGIKSNTVPSSASL